MEFNFVINFQTLSKPQAPESLHSLLSLQNGRPPLSKRSSQKRFLDGKGRLVRCLPPPPSKGGTQGLPKIHLARSPLSIQGHAIWSVHSPKDLYKGHERGSENHEGQGHPSNHLPRRHAPTSPFQGGTDGQHTVHSGSVSVSGTDSEPQEESTGANPNSGLSGFHHSDSDYDSQGSWQQDMPVEEEDRVSPDPAKDSAEGVSCPAGDHELHDPCHSARQDDEQAEPDGQGQCHKGKTGLGKSGTNHSSDEGRANLVVTPPQGLEWQNNTARNPLEDSDNRCLKDRVGSSLRLPVDDIWLLDLGSEPDELQSERTHSHSQRLVRVRAPVTRASSLYQGGNRQHNSSLLCELPRREDSRAELDSSQHLELGTGSQGDSDSRVQTRSPESAGRLPVQDGRGAQTHLVSQVGSVSKARQVMGSSLHRLVRLSQQHQASRILRLEARSSVFKGRRHVPSMGQAEQLPVSTTSPDWQGAEEGGEGSGSGNPDNSLLDNCPLVPNGQEDGNSSSSSVGEGSDSSSGSEDTQPLPGLEDIWAKKGKASPHTLHLLQASLSQSTARHYKSAWARWCSWCEEEGIDPEHPQEIDLANWLAEQHQASGKKASSLNADRSAISSILGVLTGSSIGVNPIVSRVIKGVDKTTPAKAKYERFYNPKPILDLIRGWGPAEQLELSRLRKRTIMLFRLLALKRSSDIEKILTGSIQFDDTGVTWRSHLAKNVRTGQVTSEQFVAKLERQHESLCLSVNLKAYLAATEAVRPQDCQYLFLSEDGSKNITAQRIATITKELLAEAGIDTTIWTAHSTRGAGATTALRKGVSVDEVMRQMDLSSLAVLHGHYNRAPVQNNVPHIMASL